MSFVSDMIVIWEIMAMGMSIVYYGGGAGEVDILSFTFTLLLFLGPIAILASSGSREQGRTKGGKLKMSRERSRNSGRYERKRVAL